MSQSNVSYTNFTQVHRAVHCQASPRPGFHQPTHIRPTDASIETDTCRRLAEEEEGDEGAAAVVHHVRFEAPAASP